ncbi:MAG TPA: hypothetical protein VMV10_16640 [Pirellulales bacterium]|nr:hypothetical protein [Pirellulales bacterium]
MSHATKKRDLLVLTADGQMQAAVAGILSRHRALRLRPFTFDIHRHPDHDSGCLVDGIEFVKPFTATHRHALIVFDREGCGRETRSALELEQSMEVKLAAVGWTDRARVLALDPELEIWVWSDSPHVDAAIGGPPKPALRDWLREAGFLRAGQVKPDRPKEALDAALRRARKARSAELFRVLAEKVSFARCTDRAFLKLKTLLQDWFSEE